MAKVKARPNGGQIEVHCMLSRGEAERLAGMVQNPVHDQEDEVDAGLRMAVWDAVNPLVRRDHKPQDFVHRHDDDIPF